MLKTGVLTCIFLMLIASKASATTLSIQPTTQAIMQGSSGSVAIDISSATDLYAFQFDLRFDPTVLSVIDIAEGVFLPSQGSTAFFSGIVDNSGGTVSFIADSLLGSLGGATGGGTLATIQFIAVQGGTTAVSLDNVLLLDSGFSTISATQTAGSITVQGTTAVTPEPSALLLSATGLSFLAILTAAKAAQSRV